MAQTGKIHVNFGDLLSKYPNNKNLPQHIQNYLNTVNQPFVDEIHKKNLERTKSNEIHAQRNEPLEKLADEKGPYTSCCLQVSEALNAVGHFIPPRSFWRPNAKMNSLYYLGSVNELDQYLTGRYGQGTQITLISRKIDPKDADPDTRETVETRPSIQGSQGILVFRDPGAAGRHTELWDKTHHVQNQGPQIMNSAWMWGAGRIVFWEVDQSIAGRAALPSWLEGWWKVDDGNIYYYYFSDQYIVTYTEKAPDNLQNLPEIMPSNGGAVTIAPDGKITLDWNIAGDGATKEVFTVTSPSTDSMKGTSSRFPPLTATKMK
jgi:hypothetical protein